MTPPLIKAEALCKRYVMSTQTIHVLSGASLEVVPGETLAVVGVSGAGKSTLLHILGGLDRPDEGRVWVEDANLYRLSSRRRSRVRCEKIGFVFQSYHLLPEMDVLETVMLPAMARGRRAGPASDMRGRALELLEAVGLAERATHTPFELSGGEQQRVALARALMNEPELVLADEPTGNLDDGTGGKVLDLLFSLTKSRGHAMVLVTHNERVAASCDRMLRLVDGVVE